jgi:subtilisin-like proprotein convertase family protein/uncharacterized protein YvpB
MLSSKKKVWFTIVFLCTIVFAAAAGRPATAGGSYLHLAQSSTPPAPGDEALPAGDGSGQNDDSDPVPAVMPESVPSDGGTPLLNVYLPFLIRRSDPVPAEKVLFCSNISGGISIPDNDPNGISDTIVVDDYRRIADLDVLLNISHTWAGDLTVRLSRQETGLSTRLLDQPGIPDSVEGCGSDDVAAILDDDITAPVENQCAASPAAVSGIYLPEQPLNAYLGQNVAGAWTLTVADLGHNDTGKLKSWCLVASVSPSPADPTPAKNPPALPPQASVKGVIGYKQAMPLDCESRVAVDWAAFFGVKIGEFEFFNRLPSSDNPDKGFVGDVYGTWGQIPPHSYGVHAEPVAALLREYGVNAYAHRPLSWDDLRLEIASGRPVYVFVIGSASMNEAPKYYLPSDGLWTVVAHYEHTVMVTGYTENSVTIQDGSTVSTRSLRQFLSSWSALGNMAITATP